MNGAPDTIVSNPEYLIAAYGILAFLWAVFRYFAARKYTLRSAQGQAASGSAPEDGGAAFGDRREPYQAYHSRLKTLYEKHQKEFLRIRVPIMQDFMAAYFSAGGSGDGETASRALAEFKATIQRQEEDDMAQLNALRTETGYLKRMAGEPLAALLDEVMALYEDMFTFAQRTIADGVDVTLKNDPGLMTGDFEELRAVWVKITVKLPLLRKAMKQDARCI